MVFSVAFFAFLSTSEWLLNNTGSTDRCTESFVEQPAFPDHEHSPLRRRSQRRSGEKRPWQGCWRPNNKSSLGIFEELLMLSWNHLRKKTTTWLHSPPPFIKGFDPKLHGEFLFAKAIHISPPASLIPFHRPSCDLGAISTMIKPEAMVDKNPKSLPEYHVARKGATSSSWFV